jgi:predicted  nucleic acid-binding Zn-ribbon protein
LHSAGRDFKSKCENLQKEVTEKNTAITKLEDQLKKLQEDLKKTETEKPVARSDAVSSPDDRLAEAETLVEQVSCTSAKILSLEHSLAYF